MTYGTVMKQVDFANEVFTLCHDTNDQCLQIYPASAPAIPEREAKRYMIEIDSARGHFNSVVKFSRVQRFCCFPFVSLPCQVTIQSLNVSGLSADLPYSGIHRIGVTCYMASSLQFLFSALPFVNLLLNFECEDGTIARELQKVFLTLLEHEKHCTLKDFVFAFGNDTAMRLMREEQDAHEFILTVFDKLDKQLGKDFEIARNDIFGVTGVRVIECVNHALKQETDEFLNEIQLPVKGMRNLYESLDLITSKEEMDEKWDTGSEHGKQEAVRYFKYRKLPPFLMFDLCRYCFIPEKQCSEEVRDFFDCPDEIDMRKYCVDGYDGETEYVLVSVIAHRGNPRSGHYIAFVQPKLDKTWVMFNDNEVSKSSLNGVRGTFGKSEGTIGKALRLITGGNFLAYLLGYARKDYLEVFKAGPKVPVRISPSLASSFTAKRICHDEIEGAKIYGYGKDIEWDNPETTLRELFEDREDIAVFAAWPDVHDKCYGPFDLNIKAAELAVRGARPTFIGLPKDRATNPVFFIVNNEFLGVYDKLTIVKEFSSQYEFRVNGIPVCDFTDVNNGAVVFGVPLGTIKLEIGKSEYEIDVKASYQDIQKIVSKNKASQVLFHSRKSGKPLKPRQYPTALQLHQMSPLDVRFLDDGVTACQLDAFLSIHVDLYDLGHRKTTKNFLWIRKGSTYKDLTKYLPGWFGFAPDPAYVYVCSLGQEYAVQAILKDDDVVRPARIRVDILKCHVPATCTEMARLFEDNVPFTAIEVRIVSSDRNLGQSAKTMGFHMITKASTGNGFLKLLDKGQRATLTVRSAIGFGVYMIDGRDLLCRLVEQLATESDWANARPVIVLRINNKKEE